MFSDKILRQFSLLGKFVYLIFVVSLLFTIDLYVTLVAYYEIIVTLELLILITGISSFFEVIFLLLILLQIKKMDSILKERYFHAFFSYTLLTFIFVAVSNILSLLFFFLSLGYISMTIFFVKYFAFFIVLYNSAWKNLKKFFNSNRESFPNYVAENAIMAIENFHFGVILYLFVMRAIVGAFLYLKGSILLNKALKPDAKLKKRLEKSRKEINQKTFDYSIEARRTGSLDTKK